MKKKVGKFTALFLVFSLLFSAFPLNSQAAAPSYVSVTKDVTPTVITTEEEALVTLNITGTPPVDVVKPNDVILVIDRSGSMAEDNRMQSAIDSAKGFIDLMDLSQHRVGIVDYSSTTSTFPLGTDKNAAKNYVSTLKASGGTGTGLAIRKATELLASHRSEAQPVIVLLTDGDATESEDKTMNGFQYALAKANDAKQEGIVFYTIALLKSSVDPNTSGPNLLLKEMATTAHHHHFVLGSVGLSDIYAAIVQEIGLASAYNVVVKDIVSPEFEIVPGSYDNNIPKPIVNGNTLTWNFLELKKDTLSFTYKIRHKAGQSVGVFPASTSTSSVVYKEYTGTDRQTNIPTQNVTVSYPAPTITKVEPGIGHINGGESIVITGTNFRPNPIVNFGITNAVDVQYVSPTEIHVKAPAGTQGTVDLTVMNDDRQQVKSPYLYYADPVVTSINPSNGAMAGGDKITISGQYFLEGAKVKFGDNYAPSVVYKNNTQLIVTAPKSLISGSVDVTIENPDGRSVTVPTGYTYNAPLKPTITSLTPNEGQLQGSELVVLKGTNIELGATLFFNDTQVVLTVVSDTEARFRTPTWVVPGKVGVRLVNLSNEEAVLPEGYTYLAPPVIPGPTIVSLTPSSGQLKGNELVNLVGTHFQSGARVFFDNTEIVVTYVSDTQLRFRTPVWTNAESVDVKVINPDNQEVEMKDGYKYLAPPAPILTSITPNEGYLDGGIQVVITGTDYVAGAKVFFDNVELSTTYHSNTELTVKTPAWATEGKVNVKVVNPDNQEGLLNNGFTYIKKPLPAGPTLTAITPNEGEIKGGDLVNLTGTGFVSGAKVYFNGTEISTIAYVSETNLRFRTPIWSAAGIVDVKVVNPDNQEAIMTAGFTYKEPAKAPDPTITKISPDKGLTKGGELVNVTGTDFVYGAQIYLDGKLITTSFLSDTSLRFRTPVWATAEMVDLKVINPDGGEAVIVDGYTFEAEVIKPPTITNIDPNTSLISGGTLVYITGTDFTDGVKLYLDSTEVGVTLLSDSMLRFRAPVWPQADVVDVKVVNADLQEAVAVDTFTFTEPPRPAGPKITSISPNEGSSEGKNYVYIKGENFVEGVNVTFGGVQAKSITLLDATQIRVAAPGSSVLGLVSVTVVNPDNQSDTMANGYTYQMPPITITSITPNKGPFAGGQLVYVYGTNFTSIQSVKLDGKAINFDLLDTGTIRFRTPPVNVAGVVTVDLISSFGSTTSTSYTYEAPVALPAPTITSMTPNHGALAGGGLVYVYGTNFRDGITATFGGNSLAITLMDAGTIRFRVPAGTVDGPIVFKLTNTDGQVVTTNYTYDAPPVVLPPAITSISSTEGPIAGGSLMYVYGTGFQDGAQITMGTKVISATLLDEGTLRYRIPAVTTTGTVTITVTNPDGKTSNSFVYKFN